MIGIRTAMLLYALLVAIAFVVLKGTALAVGLVIILGIAAKTVVHYLRRKIE